MITTYTERDQETTEEQRPSFSASRFGVLDNQQNIETSSSYGGYQSYAPSQETEESTPSFEVEKEYTIDGIKEEDEMVVPTFMPTIEPKVKVNTQAKGDIKIKLNARGKIIVSVFSLVAVLLLSFTIYNAVLIGNLNASLFAKQAELSKLEYQVDDAAMKYQEVTSEEHILTHLDGNFKEAGESVVIHLDERPIIKNAETPSNWFDKICEFISGLFN